MTLEELQQIFPDATAETWHQHKNGGGWVQNTAHVDASAFVDVRAQVSGAARVYGAAQVYGDARVYGAAQVYGDAQVSGDAWVETPLHINSAPYSISVCAHGTIAIGCQVKTVAEWKKEGLAIAKEQGFNASVTAQYKLLLNTAIAWMKLKKCDKPTKTK